MADISSIKLDKPLDLMGLATDSLRERGYTRMTQDDRKAAKIPEQYAADTMYKSPAGDILLVKPQGNLRLQLFKMGTDFSPSPKGIATITAADFEKKIFQATDNAGNINSKVTFDNILSRHLSEAKLPVAIAQKKPEEGQKLKG